MKYLVRIPIEGDLYLEVTAKNKEIAINKAEEIAETCRTEMHAMSCCAELDWHIQAQGWIRATEIKDLK